MDLAAELKTLVEAALYEGKNVGPQMFDVISAMGADPYVPRGFTVRKNVATVLYWPDWEDSEPARSCMKTQVISVQRV